jgi:hypothetical protein
MAHPLRGGVAKPRIFPQRGDCRVTEQDGCPVTCHGLCAIGSIERITAVTDRCGHSLVVRQRAFLAVAALGTKGGRRQKNKIRMFRWGMGGGYGRPFFIPNDCETIRLRYDRGACQMLMPADNAERRKAVVLSIELTGLDPMPFLTEG